ncbi:MAG: hypothetical protein D6691_02750 [Candidatus Hydrogenedentota bacterium]|jgi:2-iminoacetate synthase ThiH|uniref:Thiazole biosynthesis protein ThiH n=1 Tax=Sumerlaea chitinivorans TaxID=2250252 RepID=A0A2Z4Y3A4_SUMC1|nr:Thiazole biosynthesis protein ThiH [Candidatus Sumerlaea chitinivorans]RMH29419.1 MAG: hypothetical protein D6691_02750 [Candidatus Hydrogenedentota bacterium]GIX44488.1 MAG: thiamine biosynthesis protein ThiH [Candidatus Sumerlaea sp.]
MSAYLPNIEELQRLSRRAEVLTDAEVERVVQSARATRLQLDDLASLVKTVLAAPHSTPSEIILRHAEAIRQELFGPYVIPMAPVEISNACASDCMFCGWRASNREMKRLRMPLDLLLLQVEYLLDLGIYYIEFVSGDDIGVVRDLLPQLIRETRELFSERGVEGKISFCTLSLTESQYRMLVEAGADSMIVWQEAYQPDVYRAHVVGGPKAYGLTEDWKVPVGADGWAFRVQSQERALRAGLEVAVGTMLGLNPDIITEFLATVEHARHLIDRYSPTEKHPLIVGMPIWNPITTRRTDKRPSEVPDMVALFPIFAALYLLALPTRSVWVFPNCRVPLQTQVQAVKVAGVFTSTEVKLGPGGYLPALISKMEAGGQDTVALRKRLAAMLRDAGESVDELARALDEREQFVHHYHAHEIYVREMERHGLQILRGVHLPACEVPSVAQNSTYLPNCL